MRRRYVWTRQRREGQVSQAQELKARDTEGSGVVAFESRAEGSDEVIPRQPWERTFWAMSEILRKQECAGRV